MEIENKAGMYQAAGQLIRQPLMVDGKSGGKKRMSKFDKMINKVKARLSFGRHLDHIVKELMIPPKQRSVENVELLKMATASIPFFKDICTLPKYTTRLIHDKICKQLLHCMIPRGGPAVVKSKLR